MDKIPSVPEAPAQETVQRVTTRAERRRAFGILFGSMMCLGAGQSVMFAVLPSLARELGLTELQASLPFVASAVIWVFSSGYWGRKSDLSGRRPIIILGLFAFGVSFASFAMVARSDHLLPIIIVYLAGTSGFMAFLALRAFRTGLCRRSHNPRRTHARCGHDWCGLWAWHHGRARHRIGAGRVRFVCAVLFYRVHGVCQCGGRLEIFT